MGRATSHTKKDAQVIERLDNSDYGLSAISTRLDDADYGLDTARYDRGIIKHDIINRPRPYPYTPSVVLQVFAGGADAFGIYANLIPRGTFDFGDSPNLLQVLSVNFEVFSANDTYILEFYSSDDDVTYTPLGSLRVIRVAALIKSLFITRPGREYNCDTDTLYARLKSATGGNNITLSLTVQRHITTSYEVPLSTGVWPTG